MWMVDMGHWVLGIGYWVLCGRWQATGSKVQEFRG